MVRRIVLGAVVAGSFLVGCGAPPLTHDGEEFQGGAQAGSEETLGDTDVLAATSEDAASEFTSVESEAVSLPFNLKGDTPSSRVRLTPLVTVGLNRPSSLAFKPVENSLWIVNRGDDSTVIVDNVGTADQKVARYTDDSDHFMNNPTQLAFSVLLPEFAVSLESENDYNGLAAGNMFTGPTLFTSERKFFEGGTMSHLDMLHHSPLSVGIAVGARPNDRYTDLREYWVFNGQVGSVDRYFFRKPHPLGADDHSDGITVRYGAGQFKRVPQVPGHLAFDQASKQLYVADTGNRRIARLDTRTSLEGAFRIRAYHNETPLYQSAQAQVTSVTKSDSGLVSPAGLILYKGFLVVTDYGTGHIKLFTPGGTLKATVDTGLGQGSLTGLAVSPAGKLLVLDAKKNRVLQVEAY